MSLDITGIGSVADLAKGLVDRFFPPDATPQQKGEMALQMQQAISNREAAIISNQKDIIVAEMNQGDNYTKRARPSIVYYGLVFIGIVYVIFPCVSWFTGKGLPKLALPAEFWWTWGGVCSVWSLGRSAEKTGSTGKILGMITGSK